MDYIETKKREFAEKEILSLVFQGALMRGFPYLDKNNTDEKRKVEFKDYLSEQIKKFANKYPKEDYIKIINDFQTEINSSEYTDILLHGKITFGRVQKLLNLYFKYHWVFNFNKNKPPHCPIDSIILGKIKWKGPSWTKPEFTEKEYLEAIERCRGKAKTKDLSLSEWELVTFKNRSYSMNKDG